MTRDRMHALVNTWSLAVARNDVAALDEIVAPGLREGVMARTRAVHVAFREIEVIPVQVVVDEDAVAWRFWLVGTHVGPLGGIAATQRAVVSRG
jgi:hypothetical protein